MLLDAPDVIGRMRSASDQAKAVVYRPVKVFAATGSAKAPEQSPSDVIDATRDVLAVLRAWAVTLDPGTSFVSHRGKSDAGEIALASAYARIILGHLDAIANDARSATALHDQLLTRHEETTVSGRVWSLADARAKWGAERRDPDVHVYAESNEGNTIERQPVTEWFDPLLTIRQAAHRAEKDQRTIRRWIADGDLRVTMRVRQADGTVIHGIYASAVDETVKRKRPGRPGRSDSDTPVATASP